MEFPKLILNYVPIMSPAPLPANHQNILGMVCKDIPGSQNDTSVWLYTRGKGKCNAVSQEEIEQHDVKMANQIVFVFQVSAYGVIYVILSPFNYIQS